MGEPKRRPVAAEGLLPEALLGVGARREAASGAVLLRQGAPAASCFYLVSGEVALRRVSRSGDEVEIARIGAGEWFGEAMVFAEGSLPAQAAAVRDSILIEFRRSAILGAADPQVQSFFLSLLARKCLKLNRRIEQLTVMDAEERLVDFILGFCPGPASGCTGDRSRCSFAFPKQKREIAIELGMAPETLSRTMRRLESEGLLSIEGSRVEIPSCARLREAVDRD